MTRALTRQRHVGHSIAVRAQLLAILPKHFFPRQLSSHWRIFCQILALVGLRCLLGFVRPARPFPLGPAASGALNITEIQKQSAQHGSRHQGIGNRDPSYGFGLGRMNREQRRGKQCRDPIAQQLPHQQPQQNRGRNMLRNAQQVPSPRRHFAQDEIQP